MNINGQVGPVATTASLSPNMQPIIRLGNMGEVIKSDLHGRYYEGTYRRARFSTSNGATPVVTTVALAATYTGLMLSNPVGNTVNVVLEKVGVSFLVVQPAVATYGLMCGYNSSTNSTHTTPMLVRSNFIGVGAAPTALADSSGAFATAPVLTHVFGALLTGAATTTPFTNGLFDLEGSIILPPGGACGVYTSTISGAASFAGSFQWEEVPV